MGMQEDAGEILIFIYKKYVSTEKFFHPLTDSVFSEETKWDIGRLSRAVDYLNNKGIIKLTKTLGGGFFVSKLYPEGIEIVENKEKSKTTFGFEINLGLFKFSWTKEGK